MGSPLHAHDDARIEEAARRGGASEFIHTLPEEMETYLSRPVRDMAGGLGVGQHILFGQQFNTSGGGGWGKNKKSGKRGGRAQDMEVSGGQQQRLALYVYISIFALLGARTEYQRAGLARLCAPTTKMSDCGCLTSRLRRSIRLPSLVSPLAPRGMSGFAR